MHRSKIPKNFTYLLIVLFVIFLGNFFGVFRPIRGLVEKNLVIPGKQKVYDWQRAFKKDGDSCQLECEKEIAELKAKISSLVEENQEQKRLLSVPLPKNWQFLTVKVIDLKDEVLTLNLGKKEGVKEGMVAILGNTYLGKVSKVSEEMSEVRLPSFYEEKIVTILVSPSDYTIVGHGLLVGSGMGKMKVEQILRQEWVQKGDLVVTSVGGGDLLVGEVTEVLQSQGETFKTAQVKRLYEPENLNTIFLIRGKL